MSDNPHAKTVIELAAEYRRALERKDLVAMDRLIQAYRSLYGRLSADIDALALEIAREGIATATQLYRMDRYRRLLAQTADELQKFQALTAAEIELAARLGIELGEKQARELVAASLTGRTTTRLAGVFHRLPTDVIEQLLGFLQPGGPLYERLGNMASAGVDTIVQALAEAVAKGYNPRRIAGIMNNQYGMVLTNALRMTRTAQLYSYRESSRASYLANSDVVIGWQWHAELDDSVCLSCVASHGSIHPIDETLNDHYNGRCSMLPITREFGAHLPEDQGKRWFENLSDAEQERMMGHAKHEAWKENRFEFEKLVIVHADAVYGPMKTEASLKELLGE
jgi:hypothetical protein